MSEILKSFVDKGREDNVTDTSEMSMVEYQVEQAPAAFRDWPHCLVIPYIAEIRRLRAENAELMAERDRAMAVGGVDWCLCGTDFVPDHKTYCAKCDQ